jgi:protein-disulfide isomerase
MHEQRRASTALSRRALLGSLGAATVALAGCLGDDSSDDPAESATGPPVRGDPEAEVTLEVYEDFLCGHCQQYNQEVLPTVEQEYLDPGLIRYEHRDYPFLTEESWQAASAAHEAFVAGGNEAFWPYKSALMAAGERLQRDAPEIFGTVAEQQDLRAEAIQSAATQRRHDGAAEADKQRADDLGIQGTPSFVVDGELLAGPQAAFQRIEEKL